ncbi:Qat anti-phage system TatD family nuclease QatD [Pontibacter sp. MBLB2868]|uniref:Qat anti-phage system TatD family nuclease QatD n=1 Tax=Pontibacter sp. MBLB2868 TaxID=3451555 RepID=UPI003F75133A
MIDAHCHIDLYPNPMAVAHRCERAGVLTLAMTNLPSHFGQGMRHLKGFKHVRLALGMHPLYVDRHKEEFALFEKYVDLTSYIGEVGLDFSREGIATKEKQKQSFEYVLRKVHGKKKILSLHSRGAERETLDLLVQHKIEFAIFHWYSGSASLLREATEKGYYFSVNPAMLRSQKSKSLIDQIPLNLLLTETDGPFIQHNNKLLEPSDVALVTEYLAKHWEMPLDRVQEQIRRNFAMLIGNLR